MDEITRAKQANEVFSCVHDDIRDLLSVDPWYSPHAVADMVNGLQERVRNTEALTEDPFYLVSAALSLKLKEAHIHIVSDLGSMSCARGRLGLALNIAARGRETAEQILKEMGVARPRENLEAVFFYGC